MRADELASEGLKNKNKTHLQKFLLTIFFVLLSAKETKWLCWEARGLLCYLETEWILFGEKRGACDAGEGQQLCQDTCRSHLRHLSHLWVMAQGLPGSVWSPEHLW